MARTHARRITDELAERGAERTQVAETDGEAGRGDGELRVPQELLGALDAPSQEVLVRSLAEGLFEAANEMRARGVRRARQGGNVERLGEVAVDEILRAAEMDVDWNRFAHPPTGLEQLLLSLLRLSDALVGR
jgi:hypothetical protein